MKKLISRLLLSAVLLSATNAFAQAIKSEEELVGSWLLEYTKRSAQDNDKMSMDVTWVLKDKTLIIKDIPQARGDRYDSAPVEYLVDNGNLKVGVLGRLGKFDEYSLVEKTDHAMVLKDSKFGTLYYFSKK